MIDHLLRDLQVLRKADFLIAKIWMNVLLRRSGLFALAGLIAVFGLAMANVAGFYALQPSVGPVWAAAIVAAIDFVIAVIVLLAASRSQPGPEIELALGVRQMALELDPGRRARSQAHARDRGRGSEKRQGEHHAVRAQSIGPRRPEAARSRRAVVA